MSDANILPVDCQSFPQLMARNAKRFGGEAAYREKEFGIWQTWTWAEALAETREIALGLMGIGLEPGDRVAIIGSNRVELYLSIIATQMAGGVPVPLYQDSVAEEMAYVVEHCGAKFAVVEDQEQVDKCIEIKEKVSSLHDVIYVNPRGLRKYDHTHLKSLENVREIGHAFTDVNASKMDERIAAETEHDTCVMLYTSGTTGKPKGVVLTNCNIIWTSKASAEFDGLVQKDEMLAYLPMAWVGDFIFSMGQALWCGFTINCPESADTMQADLREIGPTYFFAPPRYFEALLTSITVRMHDAGPFKKWLYDIFMAVARRSGEKILNKQSVSPVDRILYALGGPLMYGPLKDTLGMNRVRVGYTAGEAVGADLFAFYRSLGLNLKQLYGQTEASVFITQHPHGEVYTDTVGVPTPGVELKIADTGEVFYRSPGSFKEYYKNEEATKSTKDDEGWVATGDAGYIDEKNGQLRIIDRAKDVGKLADGSLFAPKYVENKMKFYPNILEAVVFGSDRENCNAFVNIDLAAVGNWAERNNIAYSSYQELAGHPRVYEMIGQELEAVNASLAEDPMLSGCQVHRFLVLHKELDADDGELTRTRKVRRRIIEEKYKDLVDALYGKLDEIYTSTEVTYEDGRKGSISATLQIRDVKTFDRKAKSA